MSYIFVIEDLTVWSPALRTGNTYVGFVRVVETQFDVTAGFTAIASDMVRIETSAFRNFVTDILDICTRPNANPLLAWQLRSILAPSIVMLERAGHFLSTDGNEATFEEANLLSRHMPM